MKSQPTNKRIQIAVALWLLLFQLNAADACFLDEYNSISPLDRPNILICIADDWSFGHSGVHGCDWVETPTFDRIARQGVLFRNAYTPNAKCAPSRASLLTGRNSWQLKDACNHVCEFPAEYKSFMEALAEKGYRIGHTAKGWGPGRARTSDGKKRLLAGPAFNQAKISKKLATGIARIDYAENFQLFLAQNENNEPWCFWYGAYEPHRGYEYGSGVRLSHKNPQSIKHVPSFWPDNETVRNDMLDYAHEVHHFDQHAGRMIRHLEKSGQLENTLVIMTSDHGMPFPRCKGQAYEMSNHIPLAMMWPKGIPHPNRSIDDYISLIDLAPTILEVAQIDWEQSGMHASPGKSLKSIMDSDKEGRIDANRDFVVLGKERHDVGRPEDVGYPIRGIIKNGKLFLRNYKTDRWPAGDPYTGYLNCDASPTKTTILEARRQSGNSRHWELCFGKRPELELYDVHKDPDCVTNLAAVPQYRELRVALAQQLDSVLREQQDPRATGIDPDRFDRVPYVNQRHQNFYNRKRAGEKIRAGWVADSDAEKTESQPPNSKPIRDK